MLEFDIRVTSDGVPVLMHDSSLLRTNGVRNLVRTSTLQELQLVTADSDKPLATLDDVMNEFFGRIQLNIELKQHGGADALIAVLKKYCHTTEDWKQFVVSSFFARELGRIRRACPKARLWMLHGRNPFLFVLYARRLRLDAVGFNKMFLNDFAIEIARKTGLLSYVFTVDRISAADELSSRGVGAIVTNRPDLFAQTAATRK